MVKKILILMSFAVVAAVSLGLVLNTSDVDPISFDVDQDVTFTSLSAYAAPYIVSTTLWLNDRYSRSMVWYTWRAAEKENINTVKKQQMEEAMAFSVKIRRSVEGDNDG